MRTIDPEIVQAYLDTVGNRFFYVAFLKEDGSLREIKRARLNVTSRMANNEASDEARARFAANAQVPVVDLDVPPGGKDRGWRSFKLGRVVAIRCGDAGLQAE